MAFRVGAPPRFAAAVLACALAVALLADEARGTDEPATPPPADSESVEREPADALPFEPGVDAEAEPVRAFVRIEKAWTAGEAESLLAHFGAGKVSLSFSRGGPRGGLFTRTQAAYLLSDLLKYSATEKFKFVKYRNINRVGQRPYAVADRRFRLDGILYHDQVYVELRREEGTWKVAEIKSIDR
jgi:hypothetical protein